MTEALANGSNPESVAGLTEKIESTRAALSETVQELAGKMDVKANLGRKAGAARSRAAAVTGAVKETAAVVTDAVKDRATVAADTVTDRAVGAGDDLAQAAGLVGDRFQEALPDQAAQVLAQARESIRRHPGRWAAAAGLVLIILVAASRRRR